MQIEPPDRSRDDPEEADASADISPYSRGPVQTLLVVLSLVCCSMLFWRCSQAVRDAVSPESLPADNNLPSRLAVDLNSANAKELNLLPGVGPILATRIVKNRQLEGPFESIDDLERVVGIGPSKLEQLRVWCVTPAETTSVIRSARRP